MCVSLLASKGLLARIGCGQFDQVFDARACPPTSQVASGEPSSRPALNSSTRTGVALGYACANTCRKSVRGAVLDLLFRSDVKSINENGGGLSVRSPSCLPRHRATWRRCRLSPRLQSPTSLSRHKYCGSPAYSRWSASGTLKADLLMTLHRRRPIELLGPLPPAAPAGRGHCSRRSKITMHERSSSLHDNLPRLHGAPSNPAKWCMAHASPSDA